MTTTDEDKLLFPRSYANIIERLQEEVKAIKHSRPLHVGSLQEITPVAGQLVGATLWIVDAENGNVRGIITANPTEVTGNFYQVFYNQSGDITFGVDADDGSLFAASGDVILDNFGIYAVGGLIGGWALTEDVLESLAGTVGIVLDSSIPAILIGDTAGLHSIIDGADQRFYSSNFVSGERGFNIDTDTGDAEFNNLIARGVIRTAVFEKGTISAIGGQMDILDSDILDVDMTAADASTLTITGATTFDILDNLRLKGDGADEWLRVTARVGNTYTVLRDRAGAYPANTNPAWKKGQAVINYGAAGEGGVEFISGIDARIVVFSHNGSPWSDLKEVIRFGSAGISLANMVGSINFLDSTNTTDSAYIYMFADGNLAFQHNVAGQGVLMQITMTDDTAPYVFWVEDPFVPNRPHFSIAHAAGGARFTLGEDLTFDVLNPAGTGSGIYYFNQRMLDMDFVVNSQIGEAIRVDGGTGEVSIYGAGIRAILPVTLILYVRTDGSDSNDGFSDSAGGALRNIQTAIDKAVSYDNNGYDIVIDIGNGTYTETLTLKSFQGSGRIILQGDISNAANVLITGTSTAAVGMIDGVNVTGTYIFTWMRLKATGSGACFRLAGGSTFMQCNDLQFDPTTYCFQVVDRAVLNIIGAWRMNAGTYTAAILVLGGWLRGGGVTVTFNGAVTMSTQFIQVGRTGYALVNGITFSGTFTGKRYDIATNGVLETLTGNVNYFPGTVAGTSATGGQYT